jgi:hypothetical protein
MGLCVDIACIVIGGCAYIGLVHVVQHPLAQQCGLRAWVNLLHATDRVTVSGWRNA